MKKKIIIVVIALVCIGTITSGIVAYSSNKTKINKLKSMLSDLQTNNKDDNNEDANSIDSLNKKIDDLTIEVNSLKENIDTISSIANENKKSINKYDGRVSVLETNLSNNSIVGKWKGKYFYSDDEIIYEFYEDGTYSTNGSETKYNYNNGMMKMANSNLGFYIKVDNNNLYIYGTYNRVLTLICSLTKI